MLAYQDGCFLALQRLSNPLGRGFSAIFGVPLTLFVFHVCPSPSLSLFEVEDSLLLDCGLALLLTPMPAPPGGGVL